MGMCFFFMWFYYKQKFRVDSFPERMHTSYNGRTKMATVSCRSGGFKDTYPKQNKQVFYGTVMLPQ
jgi:hypothetical protein